MAELMKSKLIYPSFVFSSVNADDSGLEVTHYVFSVENGFAPSFKMIKQLR
jgi:hypothetical protein